MADLSKLKIKDTYQLLLQADASGNVQNLQGKQTDQTDGYRRKFQ